MAPAPLKTPKNLHFLKFLAPHHFPKPEKGASAALDSIGDASNSMLRDFSSLGANGVHGHNVLRDFQRAMKKWTHMPELYQATVPMWDKAANKPVSGNLWFLLPHELLPLLVKDNLHAWTVFDDSIRELRHVVEQWRHTNIPGDDTNDLVAMSLWGDGAPFNTRDSLNLFLWSALTGDNQNRFWITACTKSSTCACGCHGRHTFDAIFVAGNPAEPLIFKKPDFSVQTNL